MTKIKLRSHVGRPFGASNVEGSCLWCGNTLRCKHDTKKERTGKIRAPKVCWACKGADFDKEEDDEGVYWICTFCGCTSRGKRIEKVVERKPWFKDGALGDYGDNAFCGLRCGYLFGVNAARLNFRLKPKK